MSGPKHSFLLDRCPGMELNHRVTVCSALMGTAKESSKEQPQHSVHRAGVPVAPHPHQHLAMSAWWLCCSLSLGFHCAFPWGLTMVRTCVFVYWPFRQVTGDFKVKDEKMPPSHSSQQRIWLLLKRMGQVHQVGGSSNTHHAVTLSRVTLIICPFPALSREQMNSLSKTIYPCPLSSADHLLLAPFSLLKSFVSEQQAPLLPRLQHVPMPWPGSFLPLLSSVLPICLFLSWAALPANMGSFAAPKWTQPWAATRQRQLDSHLASFLELPSPRLPQWPTLSRFLFDAVSSTSLKIPLHSQAGVSPLPFNSTHLVIWILFNYHPYADASKSVLLHII
jgi:hypothetical protein